MPLLRISLGQTRSAAEQKAIGDGVYQAMVEAINVPVDDHFQIITPHSAETLVFSRTYLGIERTDGFVVIQIFLNAGRTVDQKKKLYAAIAAHLAEDPGIRKEDVFINLVEVARENWSFGNGIAQYAT